MKSKSKLGRVPLGLDTSVRCLRSSISKHFVRTVNGTADMFWVQGQWLVAWSRQGPPHGKKSQQYHKADEIRGTLLLHGHWCYRVQRFFPNLRSSSLICCGHRAASLLEAEWILQLTFCWGYQREHKICLAHLVMWPRKWCGHSCFCSPWHFWTACHIALPFTLRSLASFCECFFFASWQKGSFCSPNQIINQFIAVQMIKSTDTQFYGPFLQSSHIFTFMPWCKCCNSRLKYSSGQTSGFVQKIQYLTFVVHAERGSPSS